MADYVLSNRADADLDGIYVYSCKFFGAAQGETYFLSLRDSLQNLADNPRIGCAVDSLHIGLFCHPHAEHAIYYLIEDTGIFVIRILHKAMDASRHMSNPEKQD
ncbi:MAG: type II toxin-antitoxin system RelE/ParE family toxin [Pseudomonadota bacterium]